MGRTSIKIDRLEIRLKGISSEMARGASAGLGHELLRQLAAQVDRSKERHAIKINQIDAGAFRPSEATSSSDLRQMITSKIAGVIASKIN